MKEKTYLIALVCDLSTINMEKKNKYFTDLHFFIATATKRVRIVGKKRYSGKPYTVTSDWQKFQMKLHYKLCDKIFIGSSQVSRWINFQQVKSFIPNHGSHVKWLSHCNRCRHKRDAFFRRKNTSICIRLFKTEDCCLPACLSVFLWIKQVQQFNLLFW